MVVIRLARRVLWVWYWGPSHRRAVAEHRRRVAELEADVFAPEPVVERLAPPKREWLDDGGVVDLSPVRKLASALAEVHPRFKWDVSDDDDLMPLNAYATAYCASNYARIQVAPRPRVELPVGVRA